jgi:MFS transporter, putative metabolite:H+ symporter
MLTDRMHLMPVLPPSGTRRPDVEDVLRAADFTSFHRKAVAITGIAWTFVAMEILLIGFTLPLFGSLWNLSATWLGWIGASALAGSLVGSLLLGRVADQIGRRQIFQASILWYSLFTALTALAWGPVSLLVLRFLAGIGLGGMLVVDPSLLAEYLPPQRRGRYLVLLDFFWPVGLLIAIGLSWVFLDRLGGAWRWLFVAAALPAFLAAVARRALPESPYWLARRGRLAEAAGVLGGITGRPVDSASLAVAAEPSSSPRELFGPGCAPPPSSSSWCGSRSTSPTTACSSGCRACWAAREGSR